MKITRKVKPEPYDEEVVVCDLCGKEGGEFYTPYDLGGGADYPYDKYLELHDECRAQFIREYGPRIWAVMDTIIDEVKAKQK